MARDRRRQVQERAREFRQSQTRSEALLWEAIRGRTLGYKFRRQHPIGPFIADFYCSQLQVIVEIDGPVHQTQLDRDEARQIQLEDHGCRILHLPASLVEENLPVAVARIQSVISDLEAPTSWNTLSYFSPSPAHGRGGRGVRGTPDDTMKLP